MNGHVHVNEKDQEREEEGQWACILQDSISSAPKSGALFSGSPSHMHTEII